MIDVDLMGRSREAEQQQVLAKTGTPRDALAVYRGMVKCEVRGARCEASKVRGILRGICARNGVISEAAFVRGV